MIDEPIKLSIIVPCINEITNIVKLLNNLSNQKEIVFEVILSDGCSIDNTKETIKKIENLFTFDIIYLESKKGRGTQMNKGAKKSRGEYLLFLHADSSFNDDNSLKTGLDCLISSALALESERVAARYSLRFKFPNNKDKLNYKPYFFYESKARLSFLGCINGDQGFLLKSSFFFEVGSFDESLPFLEDKFFEKKVFEIGNWVLIDSEVFTSARRFVNEGLFNRQTLNAVLMNLFNLGCVDLIRVIPKIYKNQDKTKKLNLYLCFKKIISYLNDKTFLEYLKFWYHTGRYVSINAWQLFFLLDVSTAFKNEEYKKYNNSFFVKFYCKFFKPITENPFVYTFIGIITYFWFNITYVYQFWIKDKCKN